MPFRNTATSYGSIAKFFHWTLAILVIGLLCLGLYMEGMERSPLTFRVYTWHKSLGLMVLTLAVLRVFWRLFSSPPGFFREEMRRWEIRAAYITHFLLYACLLVMPLSGWLMISANANPDPTIFGFDIPEIIAPNDTLRSVFGRIHGWTTWVFIALILLHTAAALKHHFINRDRTLVRMLPFTRTPKDN